MKTAAYIFVGYLVLQMLTKSSFFTNTRGVPATSPPPSSPAAQGNFFGSVLGGFIGDLSTLPEGTQTQTASGIGLTSTGTASNGQNVFVDDSGDLVTINSTGGETALPDPNGIGGGFAT